MGRAITVTMVKLQRLAEREFFFLCFVRGGVANGCSGQTEDTFRWHARRDLRIDLCYQTKTLHR